MIIEKAGFVWTKFNAIRCPFERLITCGKRKEAEKIVQLVSSSKGAGCVILRMCINGFNTEALDGKTYVAVF